MALNILIGSNVHWWNAEAAYAAVSAETLQKAGHRVHVLTRPETVNEQELKKKNLNLLTSIDLNSLNPLRLIRSYFQLKQFLLDEQIDIVNPHRSEGLIVFILLRWRLKTFKLVRTRGTTRSVRTSWINRKIYQQWTDSNIFAGQIVLDQVHQNIPLPPHSQNVIYYPFDHRQETAQSRNYRQEFNLPENVKTLAIVGRISPVKGHRKLIQALQCLQEQIPHVHLLILYKHPDPNHPELVSLQSYVENSPMEKWIRFVGPREDIREIMAFADVGVVSSIGSEVICRVAIEFFSVGTPVAAFPTGCLPEIIQSGKNGQIANSKEPEDLAEAIQSILLPPSNTQKMGEAAQQCVQDKFSQETFLQKTMAVFQQ